MNKKILYLILFGFLLLPLTISAQLHGYGPDIGIESMVEKIKVVVWVVFGLIVVICFVMAAILFMTAQGQPDKLQAAKSAFIWGVVGVIVGIVAYSIVEIVTLALGSGGA